VLDGELLGGVVRAHDIRIVASAGGARPSASVTFGSLIVAGIAYPNPQPNTRVTIPGVGVAILNEQLVGGDGAGVSAIIVRAVRLEITEPSLFDLQQGTELILAHAAAGVPDVVATRAVATGTGPTATPVPWSPISAYHPIDVSLNGNYSDDNDNFDFDNGNGNGNDNGGAGVVPTKASTSSGVVITVVVVTNTPTPTATP
jgi:hypothetical protein